MNRILAIEGNIACGKSTFLEAIRTRYAGNPRVIFLDEPVDMWQSIRDKYGVSMLQKFYQDPKKYAFSFQMMAFFTRYELLEKAMKENTDCVIITERSIFTDRYIFAQMLHDSGHIEDVEYQIYLRWFEYFSKFVKIDHMVLLQTDPSISLERVSKRGRPGEAISLDYLEKCHAYHQTFVKEFGETTVIDCTEDIYKNPNVLEEWLGRMDVLVGL